MWLASRATIPHVRSKQRFIGFSSSRNDPRRAVLAACGWSIIDRPITARRSRLCALPASIHPSRCLARIGRRSLACLRHWVCRLQSCPHIGVSARSARRDHWARRPTIRLRIVQLPRTASRCRSDGRRAIRLRRFRSVRRASAIARSRVPPRDRWCMIQTMRPSPPVAGLGFHTWQPDLASTTQAPACAGAAAMTIPVAIASAINALRRSCMFNPNSQVAQCGKSGTTMSLSSSSRTSIKRSRTLPSVSTIQVIGTAFGMPKPSSVIDFATAVG